MTKFVPKLCDANGAFLFRSNPALYNKLMTTWPALVRTIRLIVAEDLGLNIIAKESKNKITLTVGKFNFVIGGTRKWCINAETGTFNVAINQDEDWSWSRKNGTSVGNWQELRNLITGSALLKASRTKLTKNEFKLLTSVVGI